MPRRVLYELLKPKQVSTAKDIEKALTKVLRTHPECDDISVQKIVPLTEPGAESNWDAEFEAEHGGRPTAEQRRVMLAAKLGVQKKLSLAEAKLITSEFGGRLER